MWRPSQASTPAVTPPCAGPSWKPRGGLDVVASDTVPLAGALVLSGAASAAGIAFGLADGERTLDSFEAGGDDAAIAAIAAGRLAAAYVARRRGTAGPTGAVTTRAAPLRAVVAIRLADGDPKPAMHRARHGVRAARPRRSLSNKGPSRPSCWRSGLPLARSGTARSGS